MKPDDHQDSLMAISYRWPQTRTPGKEGFNDWKQPNSHLAVIASCIHPTRSHSTTEVRDRHLLVWNGGVLIVKIQEEKKKSLVWFSSEWLFTITSIIFFWPIHSPLTLWDLEVYLYKTYCITIIICNIMPVIQHTTIFCDQWISTLWPTLLTFFFLCEQTLLCLWVPAFFFFGGSLVKKKISTTVLNLTLVAQPKKKKNCCSTGYLSKGYIRRRGILYVCQDLSWYFEMGSHLRRFSSLTCFCIYTEQ